MSELSFRVRTDLVRGLAVAAAILTVAAGSPRTARAASKPILPALETVEAPRMAQGVTWSVKDADPGAAALLPEGSRPLGAFRLVTEGPCPAAKSQSEAPELTLRAAVRLGPRPGVFVVTEPKLEGSSGRTGYWVHGIEASAGAVRFALPVTPLEPVQDVFLVALPDPAGASEQAIVADPQDPEPLGDRIPVVLSHGYVGGHSALPFDANRDQTFRTLQSMPEYRQAFVHVKFYRFAYRPWIDYPDLGKRFAELLVKEFETDRPRPIVLVGHSAGGLASRYAAADPRLKDHVIGIITLATPHHGAITSTMLQTHGKIGEKIGLVNSLLLKLAQKQEPDTPAMRSLAFDDFDGTITPAQRLRYGMPVNEALAAFNASDPNVGKVIAYMGRITNLWGRGDYHVKDELNRRALAAFDRSWGTADPIVHYASGTFAGAQIAAVHAIPDKGHSELVNAPEVLRQVLGDIETLAHQARQAEKFEQLAAGGGR